jgi:hypothetical protein
MFRKVTSQNACIAALSMCLASPLFGDESGLKTSIAVDIVGTGAARKKNSPQGRLAVREAEVFFYAPIDPTFDGILGIAAHQEGGVALFEIHEATIGSSKLIPSSRFRFGQYFLGLGKLNSTHRHDWPFISAPRVQREFFGNEGIVDSGFEMSVLPPAPFYLDVTFGVTNGWTFGHSHHEGKKPLTPTHYLRAATFVNLPHDGGLQFGLNYLGRKDAEGVQTTLAGIDATLKWREGRVVPFLLQSEVWFRELKPKEASASQTLGLYLFPQANVFENFDFGVLYGAYRILNLKDVAGRTLVNYDQEITPSLTWKPSEFSTFRSAYSWALTKADGKKISVDNSFFEIQSTFILGAHPAHDF